MENVSNKVSLSGFAGTDVVVKDFGKNKKMARVNLAVNESYRNTMGEEVKKTQWFALVFWNAQANLAEEQIKKGTKLAVEGRLNNNIYEAKDGTKRYTTDIVVEELKVANLSER